MKKLLKIISEKMDDLYGGYKYAACLLFVVMAANVYHGISGYHDFDYAKITLPDGKVVKGKVSSYKEYGSDRTIELKLSDGRQFKIDTSNVVLYNK